MFAVKLVNIHLVMQRKLHAADQNILQTLQQTQSLRTKLCLNNGSGENGTLPWLENRIHDAHH